MIVAPSNIVYVVLYPQRNHSRTAELHLRADIKKWCDAHGCTPTEIVSDVERRCVTLHFASDAEELLFHMQWLTPA